MAMLKHCIGDDGFCILKMLNLTEEEDPSNMQSVVIKFDIYCTKQTKKLFECYKVRQRHRDSNESFGSFVANPCVKNPKTFFYNNSWTTSIFVYKAKQLQQMTDVTLEKCFDNCGSTE